MDSKVCQAAKQVDNNSEFTFGLLLLRRGRAPRFQNSGMGKVPLPRIDKQVKLGTCIECMVCALSYMMLPGLGLLLIRVECHLVDHFNLGLVCVL